jgi:hypothetical protein
LPKKKTKSDRTQKNPEADNNGQEQPSEDENNNKNDTSFSSAMHSERELDDSEETPAKAKG